MEVADFRGRLHCNAAGVDDIFPACLAEAQRLLSPAGVDAWLDGASAIAALGRGQDLPLMFLETLPPAAHLVGEALIGETVELARYLSRSGSAKAIAPLLARLTACARRLESGELMAHYFDIVRQIAEQAPQGLVAFLEHADTLLGQVAIGGLRNWVDYGLRAYRGRRHEIDVYFALQAADARAALQRERHGTLLVDHERRLLLGLRAFWNLEEALHPYSLAFDTLRKPYPHLDKRGFHLPDVYEDLNGINGLDRYRATLAHLAAHRLWTRPLVADNFNRYQQIFIETFEDARIESLAMQRYPGLRRLWLALHPLPRAGDCPPGHSCVRHLAAMLSRALLDPGHPYDDPVLQEFVARFHERMAADPHDPRLAADLGVDYLVRVHHVDFRSPKVFFRDTEVSYRDDNRYLWIFLEDTDDEDDFHSDHQVANPRDEATEATHPFVRRHPEWDGEVLAYRPDWTTVRESLPESGDAALVDRLLDKHAVLAKKLQRIADLLKPQHQVRIRYQEDGTDLDLDVALRALLDLRAGNTPDGRIHFSHRPDQRDVAVLVLLDLSESLNSPAPDGAGSILDLSREAVSLLGWTLDRLGDPYAIAGFCSNTRHQVHYVHFKSFGEAWDAPVKARLAGMSASLSTRMGAALRHAGLSLARHPAEKKLLLLLTDGEPADVDVDDPDYLHADAHQAVEELATAGVSTFCLSLDPGADEYVARIFGHRHLVLDRIERLPERLPALYLGLTS